MTPKNPFADMCSAMQKDLILQEFEDFKKYVILLNESVIN